MATLSTPSAAEAGCTAEAARRFGVDHDEYDRGRILRRVVGARDLRVHQRSYDGFDDGLRVDAAAIVLGVLLVASCPDLALDRGRR